MMQCDAYWKAMVKPCGSDPESVQFLSMLAELIRWKGDFIPDRVGTVHCNSTTYLEPGREYLL